MLALAVGPGAAGEAQVKHGYLILLEEKRSIIARTARTRKSVIITDVTAEPDYLPIPLLPDSRSEMTARLVLGDRVLGVLNMESSRHDSLPPFHNSGMKVALNGVLL